jgi:ribonucleoside-diphosphate reductase alpha chain
MSNGTKVVKRNGTIEPLDLDKMHLMVEEACRGLAGVSASQVEMTSGIQFYDGISTEEIQEILIRSASDLIDLDHLTINLLLLVFFYFLFANNFMER